MKSNLFAVVFIAISTLFGACGSTPPPIGPSGTATLAVKLTTSAQQSTGGLDVSVSGPTSGSQKSDSFGNSTFAGLTYGTYSVTVSGFGFTTATQTVNVSQPTVSLPLSLAPKTQVGMATDAAGKYLMSPSCGSTDVPSGPNQINVVVKYNLAETLQAKIGVDTYLSVDGVTSVNGSVYGVSGMSAASGQVTTHPQLIGGFGSQFRTHYLINQLVTVGQFGVPLQILSQEVIPCELQFP